MPGGPSADGKRRQRELNGTRSGSSGMSTLLLDMERKTWEEVEQVAEHVVDFGGLFYSGQITAGGTLTMMIGAPIEYIHDAADLGIAGRRGALFFRAYVVTPESMARAKTADPDVDTGD